MRPLEVGQSGVVPRIESRQPRRPLRDAVRRALPWLSLFVPLALLASAYPLLVESSYHGNPDLHAALEVTAAIFGLVTGAVLIACFCALGDRVHLLIGLGFFVSGMQDLTHGLVSFRNPLSLPEQVLEAIIPATYASSRIMLALLLLLAPILSRWLGPSRHPVRETVWASFLALTAAGALVAVSFSSRMPSLVFPDWSIPRPADFVAAALFYLALLVYLVRYNRTRDVLTWCVALSIGIQVVGQAMMAFSRHLFDPFFDVAHFYKLLAYAAPLLGFSLYQTGAILERRKAEQALSVSQSRLRQIIDLVPHLIFAKDQRGRFLLANRAIAEAYGTTVEELIGRRDADFHPASDEVARFLENDQEVIESGVWKFVPEETLLDAAGNRRILQTTKIPFTASGSNEPAVLGVAIDITELKRAEEELRQAHDELESRVRERTAELAAVVEELKQERYLLHSLMDNLPHSIYFKDSASHFIRINRALARYFGLNDAADALGKTDLDFFTEEHALQAMADEQQIVRTGEPIVDKEEKETWPGGRVTWVTTTKVPLYDEAGRIVGTFGVSRDITEKKQADQTLRAAKDAAEAASQAKSLFLANMSHEIRTPLNAILGMTELILDTRISPQQREFLATIQDSGEALLAIIDDILDFSKIEAGKLSLEAAPFNLAESLGDAMKSLAVRAHGKGLELVCHMRAEVPEMVVGDRTRLRQIVVNLVGNAIKFTESGEVVLDVAVESAGEREALLHFAVSDTGLGIPKDKQEVIFAAFEQGDSSMTRRFGGTGLGLAISARLCRLMGGRIWVQSEPGMGSTFHFTIRFSLSADVPPDRTAESAAIVGTPVLVVDDNWTSRQILEEMLSLWGMKPATCGSAEEAYGLLKDSCRSREAYRLVLIDARMPGADGFSLAEQIKADRELGSTVIMMLSTGDQPGEVARCEQLGIAAYLLKPVKSSELFDAIMMALGVTEPEEDFELSLEPRPTEPLRILLAEDSLVNQKVAVGLLEREGHSVVVANNGREAVAAAQSGQFDLVLMDVQMPEMDGLEATAAIRTHERATGEHLPIIAMTAHAMQGDRERCLEAGMDQYLAKPIRARHLLAMMESVLRGVSGCGQSTDLPEPLPPPLAEEPFDWSVALEGVEGDHDLLRIVAEAALEECPSLLEQIRAAIESGDGESLARAAHTLKGTMRHFGDGKAFETAFCMEQFGKNSDLEGARRLVEELETQARRVLAELRRYVAREGGPEPA